MVLVTKQHRKRWSAQEQAGAIYVGNYNADFVQ